MNWYVWNDLLELLLLRGIDSVLLLYNDTVLAYAVYFFTLSL